MVFINIEVLLPLVQIQDQLLLFSEVKIKFVVYCLIHWKNLYQGEGSCDIS